jgi:hypothetical protein
MISFEHTQNKVLVLKMYQFEHVAVIIMTRMKFHLFSRSFYHILFLVCQTNVVSFINKESTGDTIFE